MENGLPIVYEMPGEAYDFEDVTSLFERAGLEMEPDEIILMEEFTLQEAMTAFEIGEPRLDTGANVVENARPPFNPLTPLLPEEVCWILDQAMAYEMEFHAGNLLAHTVFTLLYVHHLEDINPDVVMKWLPSFKYDHRRPLTLLTIVLRTAVQALLKCVDLSWRELEKGGMYDAEDWQSDKCEVSLLENVPASYIVQRLDSAVRFVSESPYLSEMWKSALISRLRLRQSLLQLMTTEICKHQNEFVQFILRARTHLQTMKSSSPPLTLPPSSPAAFSFDPYIGRNLQMSAPIRVVMPPSFTDTCLALESFLDGLFEITLLATSDCLTTWQTMADLRLWLPHLSVRTPYVRSLTQTTFYNGSHVLKQRSTEWVVNRFFYETCGQKYDYLRTVILDNWTGSTDPMLLMKLEKTVHKLAIPYVWALFNNPPRRRRYYMKNLVEWHRLYEVMMEVRNNTDTESLPRCNILAHLPDIALHWRLGMVREVVLSGFQLELYSREEIPFAYWYAVKVIDEHLKCLGNLLSAVADGSGAHKELRFHFKFVTILQSICMSLFVSTIEMISLDFDLTQSNFLRRYKWAFEPEYDTSFEIPVVGQPELHEYIRDCGQIFGHIEDETSPSGSENLEETAIVPPQTTFDFPCPAEEIELAKLVAEEMLEQNEWGSWAGMWVNDRMELIRQLCTVTTNLSALPRERVELDTFEPKKRLKWDPTYNPWFPRLLP